MKTEIINIGDELLIGQTVNTNASWMGSFFTNLGLPIIQTSVISDDEAAIIEALKEAESRAELVLITGGLGPTKDDITKHTLCKYFDTTLVMNNEVLKEIESYFSTRNRKMLQTNIDQALLPADCTVLLNKLGTASGMLFERNNTTFVSMPGVPYEMKHIVETGVIDYLTKNNKIGHLYHKTVRTMGIGESFLAEIIKDWESNIRKRGLKLAYLPSPGIVKLRISAFTDLYQNNIYLVDEAINELLPLISDYVYGFNDDEIQLILGELLANQHKTISVCESCSGGYLSHLLTSVPGCSRYFLGSIVSYTNELKNRLLNVPNELFTTVGAVSEEVVKAMVNGGLELLKSDYVIAISGVAGPNGGTSEKPVGTVWVAVGSVSSIRTFKYTLGNNRERNIQMASLFGLNELRKLVLEECTSVE
jgi:nicotinamide-nucleotide amidase